MVKNVQMDIDEIVRITKPFSKASMWRSTRRNIVHIGMKNIYTSKKIYKL